MAPRIPRPNFEIPDGEKCESCLQTVLETYRCDETKMRLCDICYDSMPRITKK